MKKYPTVRDLLLAIVVVAVLLAAIALSIATGAEARGAGHGSGGTFGSHSTAPINRPPGAPTKTANPKRPAFGRGWGRGWCYWHPYSCYYRNR